MAKVKVAYWDIRGLGQSIRFLLEHVGVEYEDIRYVCGDAPDYDRSEWTSVKYTLGLDFPNLPYYIDEDIKLSQSNTILRYLARKYNLYGDNAKETIHIDLLLDVTMDLRDVCIDFSYGPGGTELQAKYIEEEAKVRIAALSKYLGDKKFFIGDKIAVCDFHIYEMLDQHRILDKTLLDETPNLQGYMKRFEELPNIKKYLSSKRFKAHPINDKTAHFK